MPLGSEHTSSFDDSTIALWTVQLKATKAFCLLYYDQRLYNYIVVFAMTLGHVLTKHPEITSINNVRWQFLTSESLYSPTTTHWMPSQKIHDPWGQLDQLSERSKFDASSSTNIGVIV